MCMQLHNLTSFIYCWSLWKYSQLKLSIHFYNRKVNLKYGTDEAEKGPTIDLE